jgi:hypothetical protein
MEPGLCLTFTVEKQGARREKFTEVTQTKACDNSVLTFEKMSCPL